MFYTLKKLWDEKPLQLVLFAGLFFRVIAAIFSKGYGMSDDHFLVIEPAQAWADGFNYNNWLPDKNTVNPPASGHSFFYPGLHYFLFLFFKFIGFEDPQGKMFFVRLLHALFSLITVYCGYRIAERISNKSTARMTGLLLSIFWFMPFLSVRNLVEVVCIPPLMWATWLLIRDAKEFNWKSVTFAGLLLGIAFSIRYQSFLFTAGLCLAALFKGKIKTAFLLGATFIFFGGIIQAIPDYIIFGNPFAEFEEYVRYNRENAYNYLTNVWYLYVMLIGGLLIPPISLFLYFGYFRDWKKHLYLFLPSFIFLLFHSYFPNKQERFILPVIPFIITLGYIGWSKFYSQSSFWKNHPKLYKGFWIFFWIINTIPLIVVTASYSKKNRVESMVFLEKRGDVKNVVIEDSNRDDIILPPQYYLKKWDSVYRITSVEKPAQFYEAYVQTPVEKRPNYVVFFQKNNIVKRVVDLKKYLPTLTYVTTIEPSFIDWLLNKMNPRNKNQTTSTLR